MCYWILLPLLYVTGCAIYELWSGEETRTILGPSSSAPVSPMMYMFGASDPELTHIKTQSSYFSSDPQRFPNSGTLIAFITTPNFHKSSIACMAQFGYTELSKARPDKQ